MLQTTIGLSVHIINTSPRLNKEICRVDIPVIVAYYIFLANHGEMVNIYTYMHIKQVKIFNIAALHLSNDMKISENMFTK